MVVGVAVAQEDHAAKIEALKESMADQETHFAMELTKQKEEIARLREQVKRPHTVFHPEIGFISSDDPNSSRSNLPKILGVVVFVTVVGLAMYIFVRRSPFFMGKSH